MMENTELQLTEKKICNSGNDCSNFTQNVDGICNECRESIYFTCKSCEHSLPLTFNVRTPNYCYLCDPNITLEECLSDKELIN